MHAVTLLRPDEGLRRIEGEALLVVAPDDLLQFCPADREPLSCARLQESVHLYPPAGSQLQPEPLWPVPEMLAQVFAQAQEAPLLVTTHHSMLTPQTPANYCQRATKKNCDTVNELCFTCKYLENRSGGTRTR